MTYQELLNDVHPVLAVLQNGTTEGVEIKERGRPVHYEGAQTTAVRLATLENAERAERAVDKYTTLLREKMDEHGVEDVQPSQVPSDAPEEFKEEMRGLLDTEAPFEPYTVSADELKQEPNVPLMLLQSMREWMITNGDA